MFNPFHIKSMMIPYYGCDPNDIKQTTMKDNLLPFDLEEAKKDPSRVRHFSGSIPTEIHVFENGKVAIAWLNSTKIYDAKDLRLTPKRMFVNLYWSSKSCPIINRNIFYSFENAKDNAIDLGGDYMGTFELIPVKEDEAN